MTFDGSKAQAAMPVGCEPESFSSPLVSIIMPVFNVEPYVRQAVRSIIDQTWTDFELVVIDDGSTDRSMTILTEACGDDPRVRILVQENRGLSAARNMGLRNAVGRFVYFFDSDDVLEPDALSECMSLAVRNDLDLVAFSGTVLSEGEAGPTQARSYRKPDLLEPRSGASLLAELEGAGAYTPSACLYLFSRSLISQSGLMFAEGFLHEDEGFTPLLYCLAARAVSLSKPLFLRRVRADSITTVPLNRRNIEGWVLASRTIFEFRRDRKRMLPGETLRALARLQRILLRSALARAERHSIRQDFIAILRRRYSLLDLLQSDVAIAAYCLFHRLTGLGGLFHGRTSA